MSVDQQDNNQSHEERKFSQEQYDMLERCAEVEDTAEWNKWRKNNPDEKILLEEADLEKFYLRQANLQDADLLRANLQDAHLLRANLARAKLNEAKLKMAYLKNANLSYSNLNKANLEEANLQGADLRHANLELANLERADLQEAILYRTNLNRAYLRMVNLRNAILSKTNLFGADLEEVKMEEAIMKGANLEKANLRKANLFEANLEEANLKGADLRHANLELANLNRAILSGTDLTGAHLAGAFIRGTDFRGTTFTPEGKSTGSASFLDLALCVGLETAKFPTSDYLKEYLTSAFEYAHKPGIIEAKNWPVFLDQAIKKIKALRILFPERPLPKQLIEVVHIITTELIEYLKRHPKAMYEIRPRQFEELIAEILASYGWEVKLTPPIKDGGYDIFAISKEIKTGLQTSWIIECKKYASENKVGVDIVRALYGVKANLNVANALLATTSYFTKGVQDFKASRYDIELKDYGDIIEWINQYRPNPNGKLYIKENKLVLPGED